MYCGFAAHIFASVHHSFCYCIVLFTFTMQSMEIVFDICGAIHQNNTRIKYIYIPAFNTDSMHVFTIHNVDYTLHIIQIDQHEKLVNNRR